MTVGESKLFTQLKPELHHHWPKGLSKFWCDDEGQVNRLSSNGQLLRCPPKNFGALTDGHRIRFEDSDGGSIWDSTIEPMFNNADSNLPHGVTYLLGLESKTGSDGLPLVGRLLGGSLDRNLRANLGESIASLIVRSPAFRNQMKINVDDLRQGIPYRDFNDERNLIVANLNQEFSGISKSLKSGGKLVVLFSDTNEFIFGEGFLHNLHGAVSSGQKFLVPLTPTMALAFTRPIRYMTHPEIVTLRLHANEVDICNEITQVYSKDYVYFRDQMPKLIPNFTDGSFQVFEYHRHEWLDNLLHFAANYCDPKGRG